MGGRSSLRPDFLGRHRFAKHSDASCREIAEARFKLARLAGPMRDNPGELFAMQAFPITAKTLYGAFDFAIGQGE
jgi:hypothetical protein